MYMSKRHSTAFCAMMVVLLLAPFAPSYFDNRIHQSAVADAAQTVEIQHDNVSHYISRGYVGRYGMPTIPDGTQPRVLGVSHSAAPAYQAREVDRSHGVIELNPGGSATIWIDFLNTGTETWYNTGDHFVALNLTNPTDRESSLYHSYWPATYRPAKMLQSMVRPGETGRFQIALQAPETVGIYREHFHLVAEHLTWIDGGYVTIEFGVGTRVTRPPDYQAREVERSAGGTIALNPGQELTFWVEFENTGLKNWYNDGPNFVAVNVNNPIGRVSLFKHDFWTEYYYRPGRLAQHRIYTGERGRFYFALKAPDAAGYYTETFALVAEHKTFIPGGQFNIRFKVGNPTPVASTSAADQPRIRVGLYETNQQITLKPSSNYTLANVRAGTTVSKAAGTQTSVSATADAYWRIEPNDPSAIITITNYENRPAWNTSLNDNAFRGSIEIRADVDGDVWVINELPLEQYLYGLAEVSNEQPPEYLKSLVTAARSYALWHHLRGGKHPNQHFDINAVTDQVYRGYGFEQRSTDPRAAVAATSGIVVTHPDAVSNDNPHGVAVAAYSSGTDGRTRSYTEVWNGGGFAWLVSVGDPYGIIANANTLPGNHMVGLSATGARGYATKAGKSYSWILQHYYTGSTLKKIY